MSPWEWLGWIIFGNSKYTEASIDEYMENLINDERGRTGPN